MTLRAWLTEARGEAQCADLAANALNLLGDADSYFTATALIPPSRTGSTPRARPGRARRR